MRLPVAVLVVALSWQSPAAEFCFDPGAAEALGSRTGLEVKTCGETPRVKLPAPGVNLRVHVASATRSPWIDAGGWRFLRNPDGKFRYEPPRGKATLAIAETFVYDGDAGFRLDPKDTRRRRVC